MPFPPRHYATEFETGEDRSPRQTYWPQREVEACFPCVGTALPVIFPRAPAGPGATALPYPSVGSWVNLRNVGARVVDGQLQGFVTGRSKWAPRRDAQAVILPALHTRVAANAVAGATGWSLAGWMARAGRGPSWGVGVQRWQAQARRLPPAPAGSCVAPWAAPARAMPRPRTKPNPAQTGAWGRRSSRRPWTRNGPWTRCARCVSGPPPRATGSGRRWWSSARGSPPPCGSGAPGGRVSLPPCGSSCATGRGRWRRRWPAPTRCSFFSARRACARRPPAPASPRPLPSWGATSPPSWIA
ncbi:hypothetical protein ACKKBG_A37620 [Auxenochlorella protothecoides x Auxenochlorella symbiontica]